MRNYTLDITIVYKDKKTDPSKLTIKDNEPYFFTIELIDNEYIIDKCKVVGDKITKTLKRYAIPALNVSAVAYAPLAVFELDKYLYKHAKLTMGYFKDFIPEH